MWEEILPLKERGESREKNLNFLYKHKSRNIYVMDNHRAALWCWLQCLDQSKQYGLFHIDAHYDAACPDDEEFENLEKTKPFHELTLHEYLSLKAYNSRPSHELFSIDWANYLSIFGKKYPNMIKNGAFKVATQKIDKADGPTIQNWKEEDEIDLKDLPSQIKALESNNEQWILNIDLDFLVRCDANELIYKFDDEYLKEFARAIEGMFLKNKVACLIVSAQQTTP
ncbi:hypothetical protein A8139_02870 [Marinomonas primoryensis]|uniref:Arginase n=1 Tax=Marinomonas primoryensis TaxID=178399 RepID=A0A2Z4PNA0_9GAMM|nr:UPF0489 family protein [Marinomonas primoryensis]AWX99057.1 hypothetical protein A8139_02870 [Marinomonas primoryensis]